MFGKLPSGSLINRRGILLLKTQERICLLANWPTKVLILLTLEKRTGNTCMASKHHFSLENWKEINFICIVKIYIQSQLSAKCLAELDMCIKIFWKRISVMVEWCSSERQLQSHCLSHCMRHSSALRAPADINQGFTEHFLCIILIKTSDATTYFWITFITKHLCSEDFFSLWCYIFIVRVEKKSQWVAWLNTFCKCC